MSNTMNVALMKKLAGGELLKIDEREWTTDMLNALHHVNYLTVAGEEYEMLEGRLNVETGTVELLLMSIRHDDK